MHRFALFFFAVSAVHCGGVVAPGGEAPSTSGGDAGAIVTPPTEWTETSCADVKAACVGDPAVFVRGHATGLSGLDGARAEFAVRYITEDGMGLDVPHGVVVGRTRVHDGAFETCVCVPQGANMYPQIGAVVFQPGTTSETSHDVARSMYSQRYATLGDEDVSYALNAVPNEAMKEAALASMIERVASVTLHLSGADGARVVAGIVADDRPIAPQLSNAAVDSGSALVRWTMPGRKSASERIAFFVDRNGNGRCDPDTDAGAFAPYADVVDVSSALLVGPELKAVCDALLTDVSRE
ncbi:MAG: hypothetical protein ACXWUG_03730 [Polyangiales bacterium]